MLAVALVCELYETSSKEVSWKEVLVEDGHTPFHRLEAAVGRVKDEDLKEFLQQLLELARA